ncbi:hypothetical protein RF55_1413 [Lasius niger]|uniref:Uncharacterized protein n=1 Tax=Lasius niger TaxID=67767 RepID=A0A0J7L6E5_LASNI|nr:hypothetical protein RF55_1413 [Lasius niger]
MNAFMVWSQMERRKICEAAFQRRSRAAAAAAPKTISKLQVSTQEEDLETRGDLEDKGEEETAEISVIIVAVAVAIGIIVAVTIAVAIDVVVIVDVIKQPDGTYIRGRFPDVAALGDTRR